MAFAEKMRKAKKSDILKGKRDALSKKRVEVPAAQADELATSSLPSTLPSEAKEMEAKQPEAAVDMNELF